MILPYAVSSENLEYLPDEALSFENKILGQLSCVEFLSILPSIDKIIVLMLMGGFDQRDTAGILGITEGYVSQRLKDIRLMSKVLWGNPL